MTFRSQSTKEKSNADGNIVNTEYGAMEWLSGAVPFGKNKTLGDDGFQIRLMHHPFERLVILLFSAHIVAYFGNKKSGGVSIGGGKIVFKIIPRQIIIHL